MWKRIIFFVVVASALVVGFFWYNYTKDVSAKISSAVNAIPTDACLILESKQSTKTWKKLSQTNIMWEELLNIETFSSFHQQLISIDSLFDLNEELKKGLEDNSIFISIHQLKNKSEFLVVSSLLDLTYKEKMEFFLKSYRKFDFSNPKSFQGFSIYTENNGISFSIVNGIVLLSSTNELIELSISQLLQEKSFLEDKNFNKLIAAAGKKVDATVYVNYKTFPKLLSTCLNVSYEKEVLSFAQFANASAWDITLKPNAISLTGFTYTNDSVIDYLSIFKNQKAQKNKVKSIIPKRISSFLHFGVEDFSLFLKKYKLYLKRTSGSESRQKYFDDIKTKYSIDVEADFLNWVEKEIVFCSIPITSDTLYSYVILNSNNKANKLLEEMTSKITLVDEVKIEKLEYKNNVISELSFKNVLPNLFGSSLINIENAFFTSINSYIVFADNANALKYFIDQNEANKTLEHDKNFAAFSDNIDAETNVFYYSSIPRSLNGYQSVFNSLFANVFEDKKATLSKFEAFSLQFTANKHSFFSNVHLKFNPDYKQETGTLWETKLDTTISSKPYLLINHNTKAKEIFVQDDANKIYLISNTGKIIWTKQLSEKIMSDVIQLDVYKNDKLQLVFNTRSTIYMYDRNGNEMKGFPLKLKSFATNAVSVVDYENNKDYRLFIATENKRVVCYKANAEQVTAFKFDKTDEQVITPIQFFNNSSKDHVCFVDIKGKIYIVNRQGETRIQFKETLAQGIRNYFIDLGKDYSKSHIIVADTLGNVIKMSLAGKKEIIKNDDFETSPYFEYRDIDNDKLKEFIFLTRNSLLVYSQDNTLLFKYQFNEKISRQPLLFTEFNGNVKIGVVTEQNNLYLFENNGNIATGFPKYGKIAFDIGDLNNAKTYNLVTIGSDNYIYVYQLR
ncbi:MAG: DUF3352 domain-containing protein [Bacteroidia bacterium]|nr:DUF3352 domain-containing protein [Bacteroidia bacterium]